ncbi:MAG: hypothetical protein AB7D51_07670 [Desulfovibrionaceae bacterium]
MSLEWYLVPPPVFAHFPAREYLWLRLADERGEYGWAALAQRGELLEVHLELTRWSVSVRRTLAGDAARLRAWARRRGVRRMVGIKEEADAAAPDPRWPKFTRIFGFAGHTLVQTAVAELGGEPPPDC